MSEEEKSGGSEAVTERQVASVIGGEHQLDIPEKRDFKVHRIGNIAIDKDEGKFSGCLMKVFEQERDMNEFFRDTAGIMLVDWRPGPNGEIFAIITNTLTDAQLKVITTRGEIIESMVREEMEKEEAANKASVEALEAEEKQLRELAKLGEHCTKNHGGAFKALRKAKKS